MIYYLIEYKNKANTFVTELRIFNSSGNTLTTAKPTEDINQAIKYFKKELAENVLALIGRNNFKIVSINNG